MSTNNAIFYLSRIFGLAPFSTVTRKSFTLYKLSKCWLCYSTFLVFSMSCLMPVMGYVLNRLQSNSLLYISSQSVTDVYITMLLLIQMLTLYNAKRVTVISKHFSYFDNVSSYKNKQCNIAKIMIVQLAVNVFETAQFSAGLGSTSFMEKLCCCVFYTFGNNVLWLVDFQFCYLVSMLCQRYVHLNKILELKESRGRGIHRYSSDNTRLSSRSSLHFSQAKVAHDVGKYHELLRRLSEFINSTYFVINILTLTCTFIYITWSSYGIVVATAFPGNDPDSWWDVEKSIMNVILWKLKLLGKLITTVTVCAKTSEEVSF